MRTARLENSIPPGPLNNERPLSREKRKGGIKREKRKGGRKKEKRKGERGLEREKKMLREGGRMEGEEEKRKGPGRGRIEEEGEINGGGGGRVRRETNSPTSHLPRVTPTIKYTVYHNENMHTNSILAKFYVGTSICKFLESIALYERK